MAGFTEGAPCWAEAMLPDLAAGKRFYGELFGWTFEDGPYGRAFHGGRSVGALARKRDGRMPTVWTVYFAAPDLPGTVRRVRGAGGRVVTEPMPAGDGTMALVADPEGAVFGLWHSAGHPGFDRQQEVMSFCWAEVYARDAEVVDPFYAAVFGYGATDLGQDGQLRVWSPAGTPPGPESAVGGRILIGDSFPAEMPSHFLVYFRVPDCDAAAATVVRLGGRVHLAPTDTPYGRIAVFTDNQGADFGVLQDYEDRGDGALPVPGPEPVSGTEPAPGPDAVPDIDPEADPEATQECDVLAEPDSEPDPGPGAAPGAGAGPGSASRSGSGSGARNEGGV
ncbi:VOC family protein [Streptomyces sp. JNUCC 64]